MVLKGYNAKQSPPRRCGFEGVLGVHRQHSGGSRVVSPAGHLGTFWSKAEGLSWRLLWRGHPQAGRAFVRRPDGFPGAEAERCREARVHARSS